MIGSRVKDLRGKDGDEGDSLRAIKKKDIFLSDKVVHSENTEGKRQGGTRERN